MRARATLVLLLAIAITWTAPLAGLSLSGGTITPYLHFPPRTEHVAHAPFSWTVFLALMLPILGALALYIAAARRLRNSVASLHSRPFPWWGWLGLLLLGTAWWLAWTDGIVPPAWRRHTFMPLWLGYVIVVNALAYRRSGYSLITHRARVLVALFPVSALFWWLFEHLNQFVRNWYYTGAYAQTHWDYFVQTTLPFSTVLPAVASTIVWLRTFPRFERLTLPALHGQRALAWLGIVTGTLALAALGIWPDWLYPMLWLGPLFVLCGLQQLVVGETLVTPLAHGAWHPLLQPALAGLICGFFWELWNFGSLAQWHYSVPYVQRFHLFEMPLLGYAGYLPFGVECALVMDLVARLMERRGWYESTARADPVSKDLREYRRA